MYDFERGGYTMSDGIQNLQETLRNIVTEHGADILLDADRLSVLLGTSGTILVQALGKGIGEYYTNAGTMPKERIISRTLDSLKSFFPDAQIQEITTLLFHAMGWDTTIVRVYFEEYLKRIMPPKQVQDAAVSVKKPAAISSETKEIESIEPLVQKFPERTSEIPMDLRIRRRPNWKLILLVILVVLLVGILAVVLLLRGGGKKPEEEVGMLQFDLNQDGAVDSTDAAAILGISAKLGVSGGEQPDESLIRQGDVNGDSLVDASDAAQILQHAAQAGVADTQNP